MRRHKNGRKFYFLRRRHLNYGGTSGSISFSYARQVGDVLTPSNDLDDPNGNGAVTYTYERNEVPISGSQGNSYIAVAADSGNNVRAIANYTDLAGFLHAIPSDPVFII